MLLWIMKVAIFLGSKSDSETMKKAADVLREFGVEFKSYIISAHRAGDLLVKTIRKVEEEGAQVTFDKVLAVSNEGLKVGADAAGATVTATVVKNGKDRKVVVYKYKSKTGYHKKNGHRQQFTQVRIDSING